MIQLHCNNRVRRGRDFVSTALDRASAEEILALSAELEFDQQWGRDAYTAFCGKKTKRAHRLGFKAFEILRYACEIAYTDAAAEASVEMGVEAYMAIRGRVRG